MAKKSVVRLSQLHGAFRLDAECYEPEVLRDQSALAHLSTIKLGSIAYITDGQHGYHEVDEASEIRHITARCVSGGIVTDAQASNQSTSLILPGLLIVVFYFVVVPATFYFFIRVFNSAKPEEELERPDVIGSVNY